MTPKQGLAFVKRHGVVLQAARGPAPSLAEAVAGGAIRGSWWGHPKGHEIFRVAEAVSENPDVLVCKLISGKVTYVHRRLWPALVRLALRFPKAQLAKTWNEHSPSGAHYSRRVPFPQWVPSQVRQQAASLSIAEAEKLLSPFLGAVEKQARGGRSRKTMKRTAGPLPQTIDEYLAPLSEENRAALQKLRRAIKAAAPKAEECISYQIPAFRLGGRMLVAFGVAANHCAFYAGAAPVEGHKDELEAYDTSKGTIRFQADNPLPATLVRKLVVAQIAAKGGPPNNEYLDASVKRKK